MSETREEALDVFICPVDGLSRAAREELRDYADYLRLPRPKLPFQQWRRIRDITSARAATTGGGTTRDA